MFIQQNGIFEEKIKNRLNSKSVLIHLEQMKGVEPSSQPWQGRVLAVKPHLHVFNYNKKNF